MKRTFVVHKVIFALDKLEEKDLADLPAGVNMDVGEIFSDATLDEEVASEQTEFTSYDEAKAAFDRVGERSTE